MFTEKTSEHVQETATPTETVVTREVRTSKPAERTIYDASGFEIFFKHFLAGLGQAVGMIVVYLIFLAVMVMLFLRYALPMIQPYLDLYKQSMSSLQMLQSFSSGGTVVPETTVQPSPSSESQLQQARDLLQQMQQKPN